ncbi:hypothetical protein WOLCODRAFT_115513 [Wolfiporia cocos MD-104 SS10]|uniref:DNA polymerase V n=1 Tax=Wolfiporia cocos (strain MD-104) TaxID=742152 RepID=A0A2H3JP93_WOLCO|nr:hypothetical protein WOLCODRAFT_115513 [Wolfiporia cocos MD-104 SS10]
MSTTLPLFWHLSSPSKAERIDASVKLVSALEHFQAQHALKDSSGTSEDEEEPQDKNTTKGDDLDALNAQDVSYSIRRLIRGLASPRESSRLGFAVALTELLSRIDTVTCSQINALIVDSSKTQGSMSGQEERDMLFARLFGFTSVIQSGLLFRQTPLPTSASSSALPADLSSYKDILAHLLALGEKKSWLRESAWWAISLAADALGASDVPWKDDAVEATVDAVYATHKGWTPEKLALTLKLQGQYPSRDWGKLLSPMFKSPELLAPENLTTIARILKESSIDSEEESDAPKEGSWKPQIHFAWDLLLDALLSNPASERTAQGSFPEFFRIAVDESLFAATSSPERKYWGFQVFQKALPRVSSADIPMLFTKNFMRSWINHLSNSDRYLHKAARQVAADIQAHVKQNPTLGFTLILQLTGIHGSRQFDKLTKTKTVESILTSMDKEGIQTYIDYLLKQVDDEQTTDVQAINARRAWIIEQLAALIRNGAIPKSDEWVQSVLDWFTVHGLFIIKKKSEKSSIAALHSVPSPVFSDDLRKSCRQRLLSSLAELTGHATLVSNGDNKLTKVPAVASNGEFWIRRVLQTVEQLEKDSKHVDSLIEVDEEMQELRSKALQTAEQLRTVSDERKESAKGAELLLLATLLHQYCADEEFDADVLESCIDGASRMFPSENKGKKKSKKSTDAQETSDESLEPVDVLVDNVIGFLEEATAYMRAVANQVFTLLSSSVKESTIHLILTQLERRDPAELLAHEDEDEEMDDEDEDEDEDEEDAGSSDDSNEDDSDGDEDEINVEEDLELRRKIEEALRVNGIEPTTGNSDDESDEDLMDDDQMLAIDEQLAAAFKARAREKKGKDVDAQREATHFKNRVLDLLDIYMKKQPTSPLIVQLILPLLDLVLLTSSDERQLADKAAGIIRSRIGKAKDTPSTVDKDRAIEVLGEIHSRARKAASFDVLIIIGQCSLYVVKMLHHMNQNEPVLEAYKSSLNDFVTRKTSRLNGQFFQEFVRRYADIAWNLREDLLKVTGQAVNAYRQLQAFQMVQTLLNQLPSIGDRREEIIAFTSSLRTTLLETIQSACGGNTLAAADIKELLKVAMAGVRQTKRVASTAEISAIWEPAQWTALALKLAGSERFKASTSLQSTCKQIAQMTTQGKADPNTDAASSKRKASAMGEGEEETPAADSKANRKKARKITH